MTEEQQTLHEKVQATKLIVQEAIAAEREACAKVAERHGDSLKGDCCIHSNSGLATSTCSTIIADEIRARGKS